MYWLRSAYDWGSGRHSGWTGISEAAGDAWMVLGRRGAVHGKDVVVCAGWRVTLVAFGAKTPRK